MASTYDKLTEVIITHTYFPGEIPVGFTVLPDDATRNLLLRLGLVHKLSANRIILYYDASFAGSPRTREQVLSNDDTLVFVLANADGTFLNYTGNIETENISKSVFLFSNVVNEGEVREGLTNATYVSADDLVPVEQTGRSFFSKPFGLLSIRLHKELGTLLNIRFQAKATYWRYILTSEHLKTLVNPAVVHKETRETFIGPENFLLPDQREAIVFRSAVPVEITALPNKSFQLLENYEPASGKGRVIIGMMPNPNNNTISSLPGGEKLNYSEIFL
ncbi:hypothetical protein [Sediminibacterium goheungense]|uniref:Uncharacterized protein n=1 Tax=Sediminibacterium goheungense TaxID=1086393 RepID=A0A4R6IT35_9BACT|nr:hypothetical protein [Sediminibacterium goheungense]TDO25670.1 hypothetical protein BC659_2592 [Sediminibacterium goheungense]